MNGHASAVIHAGSGGPDLRGLHGAFLEDINHGVHGGLHADLVRNGGFFDGLEGWSREGEPMDFGLDGVWPMNDVTPFALKVFGDGRRGGASNGGYWGISTKGGQVFRVHFFARRSGLVRTIRVELADSTGAFSSRDITLEREGWNACDADLTAFRETSGARLVLTSADVGTFWLARVELFPVDPVTGRILVVRPDLKERIAALSPAFLRFPGGTFVNGWTADERWRWKDSIGPRHERRAHRNFWRYGISNGFGMLEYLSFAESIGARPLLVVNCGMGYTDAVPLDELQPLVDDALDAVEYACGPLDSFWGSRRMADGHPEPFRLEAVEIGNENKGPDYPARYCIFRDAFKKRYPDLPLVANCAVDGVASELLSEHYYLSSELMLRFASLYDHADRTGPRISTTELAANFAVGNGNLLAALSEAAFLLGCERNADVVAHVAYAPILQNESDSMWNVNLIRFDSTRSVGIPSWHAQVLLARHRGTRHVPSECDCETLKLEKPPIQGSVGFEPSVGSGYAISGVDLRSPEGDPLDSASDIGDFNLDFRLERLSGPARLNLVFGRREGYRHTVEIGIGWDGNALLLTAKVPEVEWPLPIVLPDVHFDFEDGRIYAAHLQVQGHRIRFKLDGRTIYDVDECTALPSLYIGASKDETTGEYFLKAVHIGGSAVEVHFSLEGVEGTYDISGERLSHADSHAENTLDDPERVSSVALEGFTACGGFNAALPPYSLTAYRLLPRS